MDLSMLSIKRPITTLMAVVNTTYFGAGPREIENLITIPLEQALGTGALYMRDRGIGLTW